MVGVDLDVVRYVYDVESLWRWLEHIGAVEERLVEVKLTVSAGEEGYVDLWLPEGRACGERYFEVYFPSAMKLRYGWMVDTTARYTVDPHDFIPNSGYVEHLPFGTYWVKWWMLRLHYWAEEAGTIIVRAQAKLARHHVMERILKEMEPLAEALGVTIPPRRPRPSVGYSEEARSCPICKARLLRHDGRTVRVGQWGRTYADHDCEVFR